MSAALLLLLLLQLLPAAVICNNSSSTNSSTNSVGGSGAGAVSRSHGLVCFEEVCAPAFPTCPPEFKTPRGSWFYLRTPQDGAGFLRKGNVTWLKLAKWKDDARVIIVVNGFKTERMETNEAWLAAMQQALLAECNCNVIVAKWNSTRMVKAYSKKAQERARLASEELLNFIKWLSQAKSVSYADIHMIGYSVGAHLAGFVGEKLRDHASGPLLGRITGLDPVKFDAKQNYKISLSSTDAIFVDVIHTNGKASGNPVSTALTFGTQTRMGHADFYPNNGIDQPGCRSTEELGCHHFRSVRLFMWTIAGNSTTDAPIAVACESYEQFLQGNCTCNDGDCASFGYHADNMRTPHTNFKNKTSNPSGRYYLLTQERSPYLRLMQSLKLKLTCASTLLGVNAEVRLHLVESNRNVTKILPFSLGRSCKQTQTKVIILPGLNGSVKEYSVRSSNLFGANITQAEMTIKRFIFPAKKPINLIATSNSNSSFNNFVSFKRLFEFGKSDTKKLARHHTFKV